MNLIKPVFLSGKEAYKFSSKNGDELTLEGNLLFIKDRQTGEVCITPVSNMHFSTELKAEALMYAVGGDLYTASDKGTPVQLTSGKKPKKGNANKS